MEEESDKHNTQAFCPLRGPPHFLYKNPKSHVYTVQLPYFLKYKKIIDRHITYTCRHKYHLIWLQRLEFLFILTFTTIPKYSCTIVQSVKIRIEKKFTQGSKNTQQVHYRQDDQTTESHWHRGKVYLVSGESAMRTQRENKRLQPFQRALY